MPAPAGHEWQFRERRAASEKPGRPCKAVKPESKIWSSHKENRDLSPFSLSSPRPRSPPVCRKTRPQAPRRGGQRHPQHRRNYGYTPRMEWAQRPMRYAP